MIEINVKFNEPKDITNFCANLKKYISTDVDAKCGRYIVDAKSILGMMSLSCNKMLISMDSNNTEEIACLQSICEEYKMEG